VGGHDDLDVNITFPPVLAPDPSTTITLIVDIWDSDSGAPFGGGDDHLGTWTLFLDASNVDVTADWWDIGDDIDSLFYELRIKHVASGGNCFGMCVEAIYIVKATVC
jgi:hypothetical protein